MKKIALTGLVGFTLILSTPATAHAQFDIIGGILKRIIMAIDLQVQRQQTQTIILQDAQKQLENLMQKTRLAEISDWVQQQKDLYEEYYQELWQVKNTLRHYSAVKEIIDKQTRLIKGYQQTYATLSKDTHFSGEDLSHIQSICQGILQQSSLVVNQLSTLINAFVTQIDDGDRLELINELAKDIDRNYQRLRVFNQDMILLSLQRAKDEKGLNMIKSLYGIY